MSMEQSEARLRAALRGRLEGQSYRPPRPEEIDRALAELAGAGTEETAPAAAASGRMDRRQRWLDAALVLGMVACLFGAGRASEWSPVQSGPLAREISRTWPADADAALGRFFAETGF